MIELRLHRDLYRGEAVDQAMKTYGAFAVIEVSAGAPAPTGEASDARDADYVRVRVTAASPARERKVAGEVANCALGLTVTARPAAAPAPPASEPANANEPAKGTA